MKRKTRFDDGGMAEDDLEKADRRFRQEQAEANQGMYDKEPGWESADTGMYEKEPGWSSKSAAPRAAPRATAPALKNVPGSGRGSMAGRTAADMDTAAPARVKNQIPTDASVKAPESTGESTSGMSNLDKALAGIPAGMGVSRFMQATARGLANMSRAKAAPAGAKRIGEGQKMLESPGKMKSRELEKKRAERSARRDKDVARGIRQKADESGAIPLAKGGMASRRADGCAQRGKTRGKMY